MGPARARTALRRSTAGAMPAQSAETGASPGPTRSSLVGCKGNGTHRAAPRDR